MLRVLFFFSLMASSFAANAQQPDLLKEELDLVAYCPHVGKVHSCECIRANVFEAFKDDTQSLPVRENAMLDYVSKTAFNECFDEERARQQVDVGCRAMNSQRSEAYCPCFVDFAVAQWSQDARLNMSPFIYAAAFDACSIY